MKKIFTLLFLFSTLPLAATPYTVRHVTAETTRINPSVVKNKFSLKPGDVFTPLAYEQAQNKLHDMRLFKQLDFSTRQNKNEIDIHIQAQDGYYFFPLGFFSAGDKDVFFLSLFEGNFFKRGETAFATAGFSDDGYTLSTGLSLEDHFFHVSFTKLDTQLRFYRDHWSSTYGVMNISDDEGEFGTPLNRLDLRDYNLRFLYSRQWGDWSAFLAPQFRHTSYSQSLDAGNHNQLAAGIAYRHHVRTSSGMGALFGFGLSDKQKMLQDLPAPKYAYAADISLSKGGAWIGADYDITQLSANALWQKEFKSRHVFAIQLKGQNTYGSPFSDQILSTDLLGKQGKYRRLIRGKRGVGITASFMYYLLRNQTGLLALTPFYELAYIYTDPHYQDHSGAGATLSYKFWRFPFPLGLNYTRNLSDHSDIVSFVLGGQF